MRAFLALNCPKNIQEDLRVPQEKLNDRVNVRTVNFDLFHVTMKFLGDVSRSEVRDLEQYFRSKLPTPGPLELTLNSVGVFPDVGSPSVAWAGFEQPDDLKAFQSDVEGLCVELGFDPEDHDFHPHVTLARFNDDLNVSEEVLEWIQTYEDQEFGTFTASELHLYESTLTSDGPNYTRLVRWPL